MSTVNVLTAWSRARAAGVHPVLLVGVPWRLAGPSRWEAAGWRPISRGECSGVCREGEVRAARMEAESRAPRADLDSGGGGTTAMRRCRLEMTAPDSAELRR